MKKTPNHKPDAADDMRREYRFDYRKARPNRFAERIDARDVVVVLDPDLARIFTTPASVNEALRKLVFDSASDSKPSASRKKPRRVA